jgi:hypothetical protein
MPDNMKRLPMWCPEDLHNFLPQLEFPFHQTDQWYQERTDKEQLMIEQENLANAGIVQRTG